MEPNAQPACLDTTGNLSYDPERNIWKTRDLVQGHYELHLVKIEGGRPVLVCYSRGVTQPNFALVCGYQDKGEVDRVIPISQRGGIERAVKDHSPFLIAGVSFSMVKAN